MTARSGSGTGNDCRRIWPHVAPDLSWKQPLDLGQSAGGDHGLQAGLDAAVEFIPGHTQHHAAPRVRGQGRRGYGLPVGEGAAAGLEHFQRAGQALTVAGPDPRLRALAYRPYCRPEK